MHYLQTVHSPNAFTILVFNFHTVYMLVGLMPSTVINFELSILYLLKFEEHILLRLTIFGRSNPGKREAKLDFIHSFRDNNAMKLQIEKKKIIYVS